MFDIAPTEFLLVVVVALVVIGPKDLPKAMRFVGKWMGKARGMARHFRAGMDTMMREAELEELEKQWKAQNEEIMRQFPNHADMNTPSPKKNDPSKDDNSAVSPAATDQPVQDSILGNVTPILTIAQADFDVASQNPAEQRKGQDQGVNHPETHIVPPRSSELP